MGQKGDKMTGSAAATAERLLAMINEFETVTSKRMFGGFGVFHEGKMFGMVDSKGVAYLKLREASAGERLEALGAHRHHKMPYFSIPESVWNDRDKFIEWVSESILSSKKGT